MKAIRKSDGKIVEVQPHGWRNGEIISYHSNFTDFYKPEDLDFNVVETKDVGTIEKPFDWQSFRNQAAKDILCAIISRNPEKYLVRIDLAVDQSVIAAVKLIEKLN